MSGRLLEAWAIHDRINRYLLDAVPADAFGSRSASKGRSVGEQFAHMHNVRLMWLKAASPALLDGLEKVEKDAAGDAALLAASLEASGAAIARLLEDALADDGRVRGFKPHAEAFLGYVISHESHHRGQILLSLKQSGRPIDRKIQYGLWEWGVR